MVVWLVLYACKHGFVNSSHANVSVCAYNYVNGQLCFVFSHFIVYHHAWILAFQITNQNSTEVSFWKTTISWSEPDGDVRPKPLVCTQQEVAAASERPTSCAPLQSCELLTVSPRRLQFVGMCYYVIVLYYCYYVLCAEHTRVSQNPGRECLQGMQNNCQTLFFFMRTAKCCLGFFFKEIGVYHNKRSRKMELAKEKKTIPAKNVLSTIKTTKGSR